MDVDLATNTAVSLNLKEKRIEKFMLRSITAFNPASDLLDQEWLTCTRTNASWWDGGATPVDRIEMKAPDVA